MQAELHRHIDVSLRLSTLLQLAQERGLEPESTSVDAFAEKFLIKKPLSDLSTVLSQFSLFQYVLDRPDVIEKVAFEALEDTYLEGTRLVEFRFSPSFVCQYSKLKWEYALDGFEAGLKRGLNQYPEMKAGLLCIASRDLGPDSVEKTIEFYLKHQDRFIGIDLAGDEANFPAAGFTKTFQKAKKQGARITVHAGEATGPEAIWEAIEVLGAERIGHGVASIQDSQLVEHLIKNKSCLEMCPSSNFVTNVTPDLRKHPLPSLLRKGVPVCINTDDPGIFGVTLPSEIKIAKDILGLSQAEIELCHRHAVQSSFLQCS